MANKNEKSEEKAPETTEVKSESKKAIDPNSEVVLVKEDGTEFTVPYGFYESAKATFDIQKVKIKK